MMTIRSGLVVLVKTLMLLLALELIMRLIDVSAGTTVRWSFITAGTLLFIPLMLIYWLAEAIVDHMTPKSNETFAETPLKFDDLQAIVFSATGAYVLVTAMRETIYLMDFLFQTQPRALEIPIPIPAHLYLTPIANWLFGFYLLIGAPVLRRWLANIRRASPVPRPLEEE